MVRGSDRPAASIEALKLTGLLMMMLLASAGGLRARRGGPRVGANVIGNFGRDREYAGCRDCGEGERVRQWH